MSLQMKQIYNALVGAWGGLIAWGIIDLILRFKTDDVWLDALVNGVCVGLCIGALVSSFGDLIERHWSGIFYGVSIGALTGALGGMFGLIIGEAAFQIGKLVSADALAREIFRAIGWAMFGVGIGVAEGVLTRSRRRMWLGAAGGILGGLVGGSAFIGIVRVSSLQMTNRAVGFVLLGVFIGWLIALVPILGAQGILKIVSSGKQKGKEILLDKPVNTLGQYDGNEVRIAGDPTVAKKHAEIRSANGVFTLVALAGNPIWVNNTRVDSAELQDGAQIQLGNTRLVFKKKHSG